MNIVAYEGAAGTGKTTRLIESLNIQLARNPLKDGQRVLALTYMHGARRRLHSRLAGLPGLRGRFHCSTFDSFALTMCNRWRTLLSTLGFSFPADKEFDAICGCCGGLLEQGNVRKWIACGFPIVIVDEAQDLDARRLEIVKHLAVECSLVIAADEFQCLDCRLGSNSAVEWLRASATPTILTFNHRTKDETLLAAAHAVRNGSNLPDANRDFKVVVTPSPALAASYVSNAIGWKRTLDVAIITPSRKGGFCAAIVETVASKASTKGNGPYRCNWECSDDDEAKTAMGMLALPERVSTQDLFTLINNLKGEFPSKPLAEWAEGQRRIKGKIHFEREELNCQIGRLFFHRGQFSNPRTRSISAMTVHQAKNREFDGVIVVWPHTVGGNGEQKRRLLYNAITRAKKWCYVLVQGKVALSSSPFKAESLRPLPAAEGSRMTPDTNQIPSAAQ
jgi:hypothetical protein